MGVDVKNLHPLEVRALTYIEPGSSVSSEDLVQALGMNVGQCNQALSWLSAKELAVEGRSMHHCVGSYVSNCKGGNTSVWSMQVQMPEDDETHRVMTIAVNNGSRSVSQARGKCNALPSGKTPNGRRKDFTKEYERFLRKSRHVLYLWRQQEELSMSGGV